MRRALAGVLTTVYGVFALAVFTLLLLLATALALVVPSLDWRRRLTHPPLHRLRCLGTQRILELEDDGRVGPTPEGEFEQALVIRSLFEPAPCAAARLDRSR